MSCISFLNTCPSEGDNEAVLLSKILQVLNEGGGSGGGAGVTSITVNGGVPQAGAVSLTIPDALLNFTDENANADAVVWKNSGATEVFRVLGSTGFVQFTTVAAAMRLHSAANDDSFTFLASNSKATGGFLEVYGINHLTGLGGATISIHDNGQFRVRSAPNGSTASVLLLAVDTNEMTTSSGVVFIAGDRIRLKSYTVGTLPAGTTGDVAYVTDASAPAFHATVAGGGAVVTPVFFNGANWIVI